MDDRTTILPGLLLDATISLGREQTIPLGALMANWYATRNVLIVIDQGWAMRAINSEDGSRQITAFLGPGDCYWPLAEESDDTDTIALTSLRVRQVPLETFLRVEGLRQSEAITRLAEVVALAQKRLTTQVRILGAGHGFAKVTRLLSSLAERFPIETVAVTLPLTRPVLADALGMTERHVSRVLKTLADAEVIALERGAIVVHRPRLDRIGADTP